MKDIVAFFIMGLIAIVMIVITPHQTLEMQAQFGITPRTFPYLILWSIFGLSVIGIVTAIYKIVIIRNRNENDIEQGDEEKGQENQINIGKLLTLFIISLVTLYLITLVGFYLSVGLLLVVVFYLSGRSHWGKNILYSIVTMAIIWVFFEKVMNIFLPTGTLF
ncbi:tripartite tricarboxylate transporter TctB family protein [Halalkalibacter krulwichiae]|uniref:Tripartite tricarboxylate transporter TctB family protein n=1 Tax=Halalkalibacter krulwichiae TaxID=199441 RepID=A0A1X9MC69_9BACI|nr:tripartite tricarboxylate transporter TctB family protein [Halalkalibacter krulwichiae]ARK30190.1 Tripartite tricarboxylate transporter TctB family protein [Halalkalibacter krulwichiae]